jgi:hypothetical protein
VFLPCRVHEREDSADEPMCQVPHTRHAD